MRQKILYNKRLTFKKAKSPFHAFFPYLYVNLSIFFFIQSKILITYLSHIDLCIFNVKKLSKHSDSI